jgi:hypothetical protein
MVVRPGSRLQTERSMPPWSMVATSGRLLVHTTLRLTELGASKNVVYRWK